MLGIDVEVGGQPAGPHSRTKPRGQDEKGAMAGTIEEPLRANHGVITLDLSAAASPAAEGREEDQEDIGQRDGRKGEREVGGGDAGW